MIGRSNAQAKRVDKVQRIVIRVRIRLIRLLHHWVDTNELIGRGVVVAIEYGFHRAVVRTPRTRGR